MSQKIGRLGLPPSLQDAPKNIEKPSSEDQSKVLKSKNINFRVTPEDAFEIKAAALRLDMTIEEYMLMVHKAYHSR